jgi:lipoyl(octanoyl) transferase
VALNVDMDLAPFARINPCGMAGMQVTQLADLGIRLDVEQAGRQFAQALAGALGTVLTTP